MNSEKNRLELHALTNRSLNLAISEWLIFNDEETIQKRTKEDLSVSRGGKTEFGNILELPFFPPESRENTTRRGERRQQKTKSTNSGTQEGIFTLRVCRMREEKKRRELSELMPRRKSKWTLLLPMVFRRPRGSFASSVLVGSSKSILIFLP